MFLDSLPSYQLKRVNQCSWMIAQNTRLNGRNIHLIMCFSSRRQFKVHFVEKSKLFRQSQPKWINSINFKCACTRLTYRLPNATNRWKAACGTCYDILLVFQWIFKRITPVNRELSKEIYAHCCCTVAYRYHHFWRHITSQIHSVLVSTNHTPSKTYTPPSVTHSTPLQITLPPLKQTPFLQITPLPASHRACLRNLYTIIS